MGCVCDMLTFVGTSVALAKIMEFECEEIYRYKIMTLMIHISMMVCMVCIQYGGLCSRYTAFGSPRNGRSLVHDTSKRGSVSTNLTECVLCGLVQ